MCWIFQRDNKPQLKLKATRERLNKINAELIQKQFHIKIHWENFESRIHQIDHVNINDLDDF